MRMTQKSVLSMSAVVMVAALAACSDSPTAPQSKASMLTTSSLAVVGDVVSNTPTLGEVIICKAGNVGGTFDLSARLTAGGTVPSSISVTNGQCKVAYINNSGSGVGAFVTVTEQAAANTVQTRTSCTVISQTDGAPPGTTTTASCSLAANSEYFTNSFHGYVVTFTNTFTQPPSVCTFTKGYYRNHPDAVKAEDGLTLSATRNFLEATPGQPNGIDFGGNNALLNLYQQYLTALINLNGASGPAAVNTAISQVAAGTTATATSLSTSLTQAQISSLTDILSTFNEGSLTGFPHCDD